MDSHAFTGGHNTNNSISWDRVAAAGKMHGHTVNQSTDFEGVFFRLFFFEYRKLDGTYHFFEFGLFIGRMHGAQHVPAGNQTFADFGINIVYGFGFKIRKNIDQAFFAKFLFFLFEKLFQNFFTKRNKLLAFVNAHIAANSGFSLTGHNESIPFQRRVLIFCS